MKIENYENAILITHNDLDSAVCEILVKSKISVDETYVCDYKNVDKTVLDIIRDEKTTRKHRPIILTDISVSSETAKYLEEYYSNYSDVMLLDHHKTALHLNVYFWAIVNTDISASMLVHNTLDCEDKYAKLTILADDYDMWKHIHPESKELNLLFGSIPRGVFIDRFLRTPRPNFANEEKFLIDTMTYQRNKYIEKMLNKAVIFNDGIGEKEYKIGLVIADNHISELGNAILDKYNTEIDMALILNLTTNTASVRSHEYVDCSEYAQFFGGGGHKNASGFPLEDKEELMYLLEIYFGGDC